MTESVYEIKIPFETVNDDSVTVDSWLVSNGDYIKKGDLIVEIETAKFAVEIESEHDGTIEIIVEEGSEGKVGDVIGKIYINQKKELKNLKVENSKNDIKGSEKTNKSNVIISKKAQALIELHKIDLNVFKDISFIRESDVNNYLSSDQPSIQKPVSESSTNSKSVPNKNNIYGILKEASNSAKTRNKSFLWIVFNYIFRNWLLNLLVKISPHGVIIWIHRLRGVTIGKGCFIDPSAIIETAYPGNIFIGDDVRIAAGSIIMTHIKAPTKLINNNLVPYVNKKVNIESHSFVGVNVTIMPGVTIGEGSVLASGSVITKNVKAYTMVMGNPAVLVKEFKLNNK